MEAYGLDWLNLLVRWLHLIAGIAWIGASFYFVMLDNSLSPPAMNAMLIATASGGDSARTAGSMRYELAPTQ